MGVGLLVYEMLWVMGSSELISKMFYSGHYHRTALTFSMPVSGPTSSPNKP
jgi:hypothetical protein